MGVDQRIPQPISRSIVDLRMDLHLEMNLCLDLGLRVGFRLFRVEVHILFRVKVLGLRLCYEARNLKVDL